MVALTALRGHGVARESVKDPPVGPGRRGNLLPMNVTAELLDTFEFRKKGRGYDSEQVDELIARVRSTLGDLEARLADATARAEAAEARAADAEARSRTSSESDETIQRTLLLAQRTADAAVQEAEETAAKKVGEAELEAKRLVEEAEEARARALANAEEEVRRSVDDSRTRLTQEIGALEQIRNTLMTDVERLEEHIELERSRLRASSDALTDMLSRSDRLGQVELPELSDHDPSVVSEVSVDEGPAVESAGAFDAATVGGAVVADDDLGWSSDSVDDADGDVVPMAAADEVTAGAEPAAGLIEPAVIEERVNEDEVVDAGAVGQEAFDDEAIDAPPPPPPPPAFDDDLPQAADEPPPPPPPPPMIDEPSGGAVDDDTMAVSAAEAPSSGFGGLASPDADLDPDDPEDNAWLAELADDDAESAGAGDSSRRRFGRRR